MSTPYFLISPVRWTGFAPFSELLNTHFKSCVEPNTNPQPLASLQRSMPTLAPFFSCAWTSALKLANTAHITAVTIKRCIATPFLDEDDFCLKGSTEATAGSCPQQGILRDRVARLVRRTAGVVPASD